MLIDLPIKAEEEQELFLKGRELSGYNSLYALVSNRQATKLKCVSKAEAEYIL